MQFPEHRQSKQKQRTQKLRTYQLDKKNIMDAFRSNQNHSKLQRHNVKDKIDQEIKKYDLLKITGREILAQCMFETASQRKEKVGRLFEDNLRNIKTIFGFNTRTPLLSSISLDFECKTLLHRMDQSGSLSAASQQINKDFIEQQQHAIARNPLLYCKVMAAYKGMKRSIERQQTKFQAINKRQISKHIFKSSNQYSQEDKKLQAFLIFREMQLTINFSNRLIVMPLPQVQYKAFICRGNNGLLVKSIIKTRPWWTFKSYSEHESCNLIWTQWKKGRLTRNLPSEKFVLQEYSSNQNQLKTAIGSNNGDGKKAKVQALLMGGSPQLSAAVEAKGDRYFNFTSKIGENKFEERICKMLGSKAKRTLIPERGTKMLNHLQGCLQLHSKKLLYLNLKDYCLRQGRSLEQITPLTYLVREGLQDKVFKQFERKWAEMEGEPEGKGKNVWICKPGENSNQGFGISVLREFEQIKSLVCSRNTGRTLIIQKYIEQPYLYNRRKFDIRCYVLVTALNGVLKGYWYDEGYVRTASKEYSIYSLDSKLIHLTNDCIQKKGQDYGKFEKCNKISFHDFAKYVERNNPQLSWRQSLATMKSIATDLVHATAIKLNPEGREFTFQLFGLDFMLNKKLQPLLIEANSNPSLAVDGQVLSRMIPSMIENMIRVAIDPVFPPPFSENPKISRFTIGNAFQQNKFILVYDSLSVAPFKGMEHEEETEHMEDEQITNEL